MKRSFLYFVLLTFTMLLASCSKDDYARVIPANAEIVVSLQIDDLAEQGDFKHSASMDLIRQSVGVVGTGKSKSDVTSYFDDPSSMGIDLRQPVYAFKTANNYLGLVAKVSDDDKVEDLVNALHGQGLCSKVTKRDGRNMATLLDDIVISFDDNSIVAMASSDGAGINSVNQQLKAMLSMTDDECFASTSYYDRMTSDTEHSVKMYGNMGSFPERAAMFFKPLLPKDVRFSELSLFTSLSFEKGKLVVDVDVEPNTERAQHALELIDKNVSSVKGSYIDAVPDNFFMFASLNAKGDWLLQNLKGMPEVSEYLTVIERAIDIEQMIRSIDGDVSITMPMLSYQAISNAEIPDFIITAEIARKDFLEDVPYWMQSMRQYGVSMRQTDKDCYVMRHDDMELCWGVQDSELYLATAPAFRSNAASARSSKLKGYADLIRQSNVFVYVDLHSAPLVGFHQVPVVGPGIQRLRTFIARSSGANELQFIIESDNADDNFLKAIW